MGSALRRPDWEEYELKENNIDENPIHVHHSRTRGVVMVENGDSRKSSFKRLVGSRTNLLLGILAMIIIFGSLSALVYNAMNTRSTDVLTVNGVDYDWDTIQNDFETIEYDGNSGISVEELIKDSGVKETEGKSFRFIGSDGYEKEVPWDDMKNGIIDTNEKKVIFPELAKAFWVRDLVEIEVV